MMQAEGLNFTKVQSEIIHCFCCFILFICYPLQTSLGYDQRHITCLSTCHLESTFSLLSGPYPVFSFLCYTWVCLGPLSIFVSVCIPYIVSRDKSFACSSQLLVQQLYWQQNSSEFRRSATWRTTFSCSTLISF